MSSVRDDSPRNDVGPLGSPPNDSSLARMCWENEGGACLPAPDEAMRQNPPRDSAGRSNEHACAPEPKDALVNGTAEGRVKQPKGLVRGWLPLVVRLLAAAADIDGLLG